MQPVFNKVSFFELMEVETLLNKTEPRINEHINNELSLQIHQVLLKNSNFAVIEVAHKISHQEKEMFDRIIDLSK